jgi:hypothetical protein
MSYFVVKMEQLHRALREPNPDFHAGLIDSLDIGDHTPEAVQPDLPKRPENLSIKVEGPKYVTDDGIESFEVEMHYGAAEGKGKTVSIMPVMYEHDKD